MHKEPTDAEIFDNLADDAQEVLNSWKDCGARKEQDRRDLERVISLLQDLSARERGADFSWIVPD